MDGGKLECSDCRADYSFANWNEYPPQRSFRNSHHRPAARRLPLTTIDHGIPLLSENHNLDAAWQYHTGTKHSYLSIRTNPHELDWDNKPLLFKIYPTLEVLRLPRDFREVGVAALSAIADSNPPAAAEAIPDLETLAQLLFFSAGVTKSRKHAQGETFFPGRGLYRRSVRNRTLRRLHRSSEQQNHRRVKHPPWQRVSTTLAPRSSSATIALGDFRKVILDATANDPAVARAPVVIICTGTYWRNAWKYRSRTYRHFGWDNGTILANLLANSSASTIPAKIVTGFVNSAT